jgi:uncharacterized membrane protein
LVFNHFFLIKVTTNAVLQLSGNTAKISENLKIFVAVYTQYLLYISAYDFTAICMHGTGTSIKSDEVN